MKVWQVKIETIGTFLLKQCPTGGSLCNSLKEKKLTEEFFSALKKSLTEKGWENRPLASLICLDLGNPFGYVDINCIPIELLD